MSGPKTSERMAELIGRLIADAHKLSLSELMCGNFEQALVTAIAELEQENAHLRAYRDSKPPCHHSISGIVRCDACYIELRTECDQWRECAVALWAQAEACRRGDDECATSNCRVNDALEDLGSKWNEAMKEKG